MENKLTAEEIIQWLEAYRRLMIEVWTKNPNLYEVYLRQNEKKSMRS